MPRKWQHVAERAARMDDGDTLWSRGLTKVPWADWEFKPIADNFNEWRCRDEICYFTGNVYGDGSKLGFREWSQCGWAAAQVEAGTTVRMCNGPLPLHFPVQRRIKRAELWAFYRVLCDAVLPLSY